MMHVRMGCRKGQKSHKKLMVMVAAVGDVLGGRGLGQWGDFSLQSLRTV